LISELLKFFIYKNSTIYSKVAQWSPRSFDMKTIQPVHY